LYGVINIIHMHMHCPTTCYRHEHAAFYLRQKRSDSITHQARKTGQHGNGHIDDTITTAVSASRGHDATKERCSVLELHVDFSFTGKYTGGLKSGTLLVWYIICIIVTILIYLPITVIICRHYCAVFVFRWKSCVIVQKM